MKRSLATQILVRVAAGCLLVLLAPLGALLYALVKLDSSGPFLFTQKRMGYLGREFTVYKIRTMAQGSEGATALGTRTDGAYVTRLGALLRKLKVDELPQLWNVVRGEMAVVGPRPIPLALYYELCEHIPSFPERNSVPPGLTNLSQISLAENKLGAGLVEDWNTRFEGELHYIRHKNVWYDAAIIVMTMLYVGRRLLGRQRQEAAVVEDRAARSVA